ncbi:MAG: amino acid--tRNA ligase-related protein [Candidatus Bathyarchaeia archaeon]
MSSMILYKQMAVSSLERVFALSPNVRLEPSESIEIGRHLSEFRQLDLEVADASYFDVMDIGERMVRYTCRRIREACRDVLLLLGRDLKVPSVPFRKMTHEEAVELLRSEGYKVNKGDEIPWAAEEAISRMFEEHF